MKKPSNEMSVSQKAIESYMLESPAKEDWEKVDSVFLDQVFLPFLSKHKLKQDCVQCGSLFFEYNCLIDKEGKMTEISLQNTSVDCKGMTEKLKKEMEEVFLKYYQETAYPESLRGKKIFFRAGRAMRC